MTKILGIDVGGTGIKGAVVDTEKGVFITEKIKYGTPKPSTPVAVMGVINQLIDDFGCRDQKIGCGFPSVIKNDICYTAANIDKGWIGIDMKEHFKKYTGCDVYFINDADAAAVAEVKFGKGKNRKGTVVLLTLGTGIGSGLFLDGKLLPNSEFGHLLYKESIFEHYASNGARKKKDLSWKEWGQELNVYLNHVQEIINPNLIILGGGVSKHFEKYKKHLKLDTELVSAAMGNDAGIIGAAMLVADL